MSQRKLELMIQKDPAVVSNTRQVRGISVLGRGHHHGGQDLTIPVTNTRHVKGSKTHQQKRSTHIKLHDPEHISMHQKAIRMQEHTALWLSHLNDKFIPVMSLCFRILNPLLQRDQQRMQEHTLLSLSLLRD